MSVFRLYLPEPLQSGAELILSGERAHYVCTVLRARPGTQLTVFNGQGGEYSAELIAAGRRQAHLKIGLFRAQEVESPLRIHLGLAIAKGERMDLSVQKATELGVASIAPLFTERCNVQLGGKAEHKRRHWEKIAISACEQCGRNRIPEVLPVQGFETWVSARRGGVMLDPGGIPLPSLPEPGSCLTLLVGPEGGLSLAERQRAESMGFVSASLGPRILRIETAVIAALSVAQALWGDGRGCRLV